MSAHDKYRMLRSTVWDECMYMQRQVIGSVVVGLGDEASKVFGVKAVVQVQVLVLQLALVTAKW